MDTARRMGAKDSQTRAKLLDAAERLMLEEGYAAVTSRRVGQKAGISSQLVHYYFRTMDDLFLEVFRRSAEAGFARFERAIEAQPSLRTIWSSLTDGSGSVFNLEFAALANHRKAIRAEIASFAERFRAMQLDAISAILATRGAVAGQDHARGRARRHGRCVAAHRGWSARSVCAAATSRRSHSSSSTSTTPRRRCAMNVADQSVRSAGTE